MVDQSPGMLSPSSASASHRSSSQAQVNGSHMHNGSSRPGLEPSTSTSSRSRVFDRLKPWKTSTSVAGRRKSGLFSSSSTSGARRDNDPVAGDPYVVQAVASGSGSGSGSSPNASVNASRRSVDGYEWEGGSDIEDESVEPDVYSWIDPSVVGSAIGHSPSPGAEGEMRSPGAASSLLQGPVTPVDTREPTHDPDRPILHPAASYGMLLAYQSTSSSSNSNPTTRQPSHRTPIKPPSEAGHRSNDSSQWHEFVDRSMIPSLGKHETQRQGLWFEVINGEMEYVKDLKMLCDDFIAPLRTQQPPVIVPEQRMEAFVREVFSTTQSLAEAHTRMLDRLLERQRQEWPLMTSAADILLTGFFEMAELYEKYMKNYPFSDARVKRERDQNPKFRLFLNDRTTAELTQRRDVFVLLSRPMTRLPRIMLQLTTALQYTPPDHPDHEGIPALTDSISRIIKGSQPGIESAESKIKLWNVAEKLLFKRGEIIELDITDGKRTLVHEGYVFRRIRSETNWHGWQDLRMILLDNYMLLTRDEEQGRLVVVSRPIHLDFLQILSADGQPERRHDGLTTRWKSNGISTNGDEPERLMYPFTISTSGGSNGRTYTLCTATQSARNVWRDKIQGAKTIRHFDLESNKLFAMHPIKAPPAVRSPILAAELFTWRGRETIALAAAGSVWVGWRHDSASIRELMRLPGPPITSIAIVNDFGWILVVQGGALSAFNLNEMIPTSDTSTWVMAGKLQAVKLSPTEHNVSFVRIGYTKDRLMVAYAALTNNSTILSYYEPLVVYDSNSAFRHFATTSVPGQTTEISFFKQTIAIVTDKSIIIAEPGNPTFNQIPSFPGDLHSPVLRRMMDSAKPLAMYQTSENEFVLVYQWGACFVTKFGEISRNGLYLRWNLAPTYSVYKAPCLLLFDESAGQVEVRDITNGKMCELISEKGLRAVKGSKRDGGEILALGQDGLMEIKETVPL